MDSPPQAKIRGFSTQNNAKNIVFWSFGKYWFLGSFFFFFWEGFFIDVGGKRKKKLFGACKTKNKKPPPLDPYDCNCRRAPPLQGPVLPGEPWEHDTGAWGPDFLVSRKWHGWNCEPPEGTGTIAPCRSVPGWNWIHPMWSEPALLHGGWRTKRGASCNREIR